MSYLEIKNFKYGLDTRRSELTSNPGTLLELTDGHINQGGQIEKRKCFGFNPLPANTFGLQETSRGLYVFGTMASVTFDSATQNMVPMFYQQLQHPAVLAGVSFDPTKHEITAIVASCQYDDKPFAAAKFTDGNTFCYYNGNLVTDFTSGLVMQFMTSNADIAKNLTDSINNSVYYTAIQNPTTEAHKVDSFSRPGYSYGATTIVESTANIAVATQRDVGFAQGNVYVVDSAQSTVVGSKLTIGSKVYTFVVTPSVEGDVKIGANNTATLTNLYNAINHTGTPGTDYVCAAVNPNVYAQDFIKGTAPTFVIINRVSNIQNEIANNVNGVTYLQDADTVPKNVSQQSIGQFTLVAVNPAFATAWIATNAGNFPQNTNTVTVGSVTYTVRTTPNTSPTDVMVYSSRGLAASALGAVINGQKTFVINGTTYVANSFAGSLTPNPDVYAMMPVSVSTLFLRAKVGGSAGNALVLSHTGGNYNQSAGFANGIDNSFNDIQVGPIAASGQIITNGTNPANNDTVTIGGRVYTFKTVLSGTDAILIGPSAQSTLTNLLQSINGTGVVGTDYNTATINSTVKAVPSLNGNVLQLVSRLSGTQGNVAITVSSANLTVNGMANGKDYASLLGQAFVPGVQKALGDYVAVLVDAINGYSDTSGFFADNIDNTIYIHSVLGNSYANNADVVVLATGQIAIGFCQVTFDKDDSVVGSQNKVLNGTVNVIEINGQPNLQQLNGVNHTLDTGAAPSNSYGAGKNTAASVDTDITGFCISIAADVNAQQTFITCTPVGNSLYFSKSATSSADKPWLISGKITVGAQGTLVAVSVGQNNFGAAVAPLYVGFRRHPIGGSFSTPNAVDYAVFALSGGSPYGIARGLGFGGFGSKRKMKTENYSPIIVTCRAFGGFPPYKYQWQWVSGDKGFVVSNEAASSVTFGRPDTAGSVDAYWQCVVTDDVGNVINSNQVHLYQP